ncbi:LysR substrate-binding domain-containing protein [Mobilicoccus sp.]|uniref:LysR substrate-binding domain-containing protein n=1 Tax=Mobilicoccus sp. TaxID=2034349 RepID=UPI0028AB9262|nr:LysR substrate-binding domain-containing protein [Mobilicoccus sp.]
MDLRQLRYFVAVAEECHFGRAAQRLHMAQPPLSQAIRRLEEDLGVELLERTTRRVALTPAGERFLDRSRQILHEVDQAAREAARIAAGEIGRVVIGVVGSATYALLPPVARRLREEYPDIDFEFTSEMLTADQVSRLGDGTIDIALMRPPLATEGLLLRVLRSEPLVVALPESHPLASRDVLDLGELRDETFVTYPADRRSVLYDTFLAACEAHGFHPTHTVQVAQTSTIVVFVAAGIGVAVLPASAAHLRLEGVRFLPLADTPSVELAVGWRPGASATTQRVVDRLTQLVSEGDSALSS